MKATIGEKGTRVAAPDALVGRNVGETLVSRRASQVLDMKDRWKDSEKLEKDIKARGHDLNLDLVLDIAGPGFHEQKADKVGNAAQNKLHLKAKLFNKEQEKVKLAWAQELANTPGDDSAPAGEGGPVAVAATEEQGHAAPGETFFAMDNVVKARFLQRVRARDPKGAQLALDVGADIDHRDQKGATALHHAVLAGDDTMLEWLLAQGADAHLEDKKGALLWPYHSTFLMIGFDVRCQLLACRCDLQL